MAYPNDGEFPGSLVSTTNMVLHTDGETVLAAHMNVAQAEVIQIEAELGVNPSGSAATVAARVAAAEGLVPTHAGLTTATHGMGASVLVGTALTQTLTNKTLTTPVVNGATLNGDVAGNPNFTGNVSFDNVSVSGTSTGLGNPTGTVIMMMGTGSVPGYLALDGTVTVTPGTYPTLCTWLGVSTTYLLPDMADSFPVGKSGTKAVGAVGGADTVTLSSSNLPSHAHTMNHGHGAAAWSGDGGHAHSGVMQTFGVAVNTSHGYDLLRPFSENNYATQGSVGGGAAHNNALPRVSNADGNHGHQVTVLDFSGSTGSAGASAPVTVTPKFMAFRFLIKT